MFIVNNNMSTIYISRLGTFRVCWRQAEIWIPTIGQTKGPMMIKAVQKYKISN